jgi:hypothetical protein
MNDELQRAWKEFGKQTQAGKMLYDLYGVRYRPDQHISYPKQLKMKPKVVEEKKEPAKRAKSISYPVMQKKPSRKINMIDICPKRKHLDDIKHDMDDIKREIKGYGMDGKKTVNRKAEIMKLQDRFQYQERTVMPKGCRLPGLKEKDVEEVDQVVSSNRPKRLYDRRDELDEMYDLTLKDIDERYVYMEEMKKLGKNVDLNIMSEIRTKIDDMRNIQKLIDEYDRNNS